VREKEYNTNLSELLTLAQNGDTFARDKIVEENIGLVHSIVKRFAGRGFETEDLFQIGCIGLIKAIPKFDMSYDVKFSTYAVPMIMGEIKRFIRDDGIIKVSRSVKELAQKALALRENIMKTEVREAGISELATRLGVSREEVAVALEAGIRPDSINAPCGDDKFEGKTLEEKTINDVFAYFTLYWFIFLIVVFLLSIDPINGQTVTIVSDAGQYTVEHGFFSNFSATLSCLCNIGPGFEAVGPYAGFAGYSVFSKILLSLIMILGRLEILPVLILFNPRTWKKI
jgi:RNA polymerase sporulation-specific sigma factor